MAIDTFLKMDPLKGESVDSKHKDEIQVLSWGFGISFMHDASGPQGRGGRSEFGPLTITKSVDISSVQMYIACAEGSPYKTAKLSVQSATGTDKNDVLVIDMEDVRISSISPGGGGDIPMESVSMSYATIKWTYKKFGKNGAAEGDDSGGWDLREKKKL